MLVFTLLLGIMKGKEFMAYTHHTPVGTQDL